MAKRVIDDSTLTAIANKIREKATDSLGNDTFTPTEMPERVDFVYLAGLADGFWNGYQSCEKDVVNPARDKLSKRIADTTGEGTLDEWVDKAIEDFDSIEAAIEAQGVDVPDFNTAPMAGCVNEACNIAYSEGIEQGKQAQYDEFWDTVQSKGTRTWYECAFSGSSWTNANFKPKYDIHVEYGYNMFFRNRGITDLKALLENAGVVLDFSNATDCYSLFALCYNMTHIPELNFTKWSQLNNTFYECRKLHTIDKIIIPNCTSIASDPFYNCIALANIVFEGVISANISLAYSPLSKDSITSVINALSATATSKTLTLKKSAVNTAFAWNFVKEEQLNDVYIGSVIEYGAEYINAEALRNDWGDGVEIGEYILLYDDAPDSGQTVKYRKAVLKKVGTNINESTGVDHGVWTVSAAVGNTYDANGMVDEADIGECNDVWTSLVEAKSNWTISLV